MVKKLEYYTSYGKTDLKQTVRRLRKVHTGAEENCVYKSTFKKHRKMGNVAMLLRGWF